MQLELGLLPGQAGLRKPWCLKRGRREAAITAPARASAADDSAGAGMGEIGDEMSFGVEDLRADGDAQHGVFTVRAVLPRAPARAPTTRRVLPPRPERRQVAEVGIGDEHDVPAVPAVTAVRPTSGHVLLTPEAERAVSPTPCDRGDAGAIVEHRWPASR